MSKTIKQIADEIGVSKQAVQKRISREPLYTSIQPYISTVGGTKYIEVVGVNLIVQAFKNTERQPVVDNQPKVVDNDIYTAFQPILDTLRLELDILNNQLSAKDKQMEVKDKQIEDLSSQLVVKDKLIEDLNNRLFEAHQLTNNAQSLHVIDKGNEYSQQLIQETPDKTKTEQSKKIGFWSKIFGNKDDIKGEQEKPIQ